MSNDSPDNQPSHTSRRRFLSASGAAWAAATLAPWAGQRLLAQDTATTAKPLGWAFVGLGQFTQNQLLPGVSRCKYSRCVAVVTGHPEKVDRPNRKLGGKSIKEAFGLKDSDVYGYDNFDAIKDNKNIDIVYIVLPNGMHCEYTVRAFQAGKHVMCEKPMANTVAECRQMLDAAKAAGKKLQIGYRMHWDAPTAACIQALRRGDIGRIKTIEAAAGFNVSPGVWRLDRKLAGGGCLMDIGIYALSAARYLSGEEPIEVTGHTSSPSGDPRFTEVEGDCRFELKFPSGVTASCDSSYARGLGRFAVHGTNGMALMQPASGYMEPPRYNGTKFHITRNGQGDPQPVDVPPADHFVGEMDGFSLALQNAAPYKATGEEGLQDVRIMEAIYESARVNKAITLG